MTSTVPAIPRCCITSAGGLCNAPAPDRGISPALSLSVIYARCLQLGSMLLSLRPHSTCAPPDTDRLVPTALAARLHAGPLGILRMQCGRAPCR